MSNQQNMLNLEKYLTNFAIKEIDKNINFWMVRTKAGYFYNEFITDKFIALGWNTIDLKTEFGKQSIEILKEQIRERYGESRPMGPINKCRHFIEDVKSGDYVIIPNAGSSEITVAVVGEYYEEDGNGYWEEIHANQKIKNKECEINSIKCPYKKRRSILPLLKIKAEKIGFNLIRGMNSKHGLSDMNEYAVDILNCVYNCYTYQEDIMFNINIDKKEPIRPRELSKLMYGITEFFAEIADEDDISVTINLNSPGKTTINYKKGFKKLKKKAVPLIAIYIAVTGGSVFGCEFPGIIGVIKEYRTMNIQVQKEEEDLEGQKLDNYLKTIDLIEKSEDLGIDVTKALKDLEVLEDLNASLEFKSNEEFAQNKDGE